MKNPKLGDTVTILFSDKLRIQVFNFIFKKYTPIVMIVIFEDVVFHVFSKKNSMNNYLGED